MSTAGGKEITIFYISEENDAAQYQFQVLMNGDIWNYISLTQKYVVVTVQVSLSTTLTNITMGWPVVSITFPIPRKYFPSIVIFQSDFHFLLFPSEPHRHPTPSQ